MIGKTVVREASFYGCTPTVQL